MGECLAYGSLQADSKVKFAAWPTSWRPPGAGRLSLRGPKVNFHLWLCIIDDSSMNIVLCIIIVIIIIIIIKRELTVVGVDKGRRWWVQRMYGGKADPFGLPVMTWVDE